MPEQNTINSDEELISSLNLRIRKLEYVLNAFHIDPEKALSMIEANDHVQLHRAGMYGAALMQQYGKLDIGAHEKSPSPLMEKWLWSTPGFTDRETGVADMHQHGVNDYTLQPIIKEPTG